MSIALLHSPSDIVAKLLADVGLATEPSANGAWPAYDSKLPSTPDNCIAVYDSAPQPDGRSQVDGQVLQHYGVQVLVRGTTQPVSYVRVESILTILAESVANRTVLLEGHVYVVTCFSKLNVLRMGDEPDSKLHLYSLNALVSIRQLS